MTIRIFLSYSHSDAKHLDKLKTHLSTLRRRGLIEHWDDRCIVPGEAFEPAIYSALDSANIVVLLVSAEFIASDFCYRKEMLRALERASIGSARVIPVIVRPCDWKDTPLADLQVLPRNAVPLSLWTDPDAGYLNVAEGITRVVEQLTQSREVSPAKPVPVASVKRESIYAKNAIALPVDGIVVKLLDDQCTAIVGSANGLITAIDLRSGALLATATALNERDRQRAGCGEIKYVGDCFFFLQRGPLAQSFFTMGHAGVLKSWVYDGALREQISVDLLTPHREKLRQRIVKAQRGIHWSCWTVYSNPIQPELPSGIVAAKLSQDGSSIVCLTEWFAIFRCDLCGRLRDEPLVLGDAFAIEPANPDGSQVWVGCSSMRDALYLVNLQTGTIQRAAGDAHGFDVARRGIHRLSPQTICVGGVALALPDLAQVPSSQFSRHSSVRPLVLPDQGLVLNATQNKIWVYDLTTLKFAGEPLLAGHTSDIRDLDATADGEHLVSLAKQSLRVWSLPARAPLEGYPAAEVFLRDGPDKIWRSECTTSTGDVLYRVSGPAASEMVIVDTRKRRLSRIAGDWQSLLGAAGDRQEFHFLRIETREGPPLRGLRGVASRLLNMSPPDQYVLRHTAISSGRVNDSAIVILAGGRLWPAGGCEPRSDNSLAIDIGDGRLALLTAGHLAIYSSRSRALVVGPVDATEGTYSFYAQLVVSADKTRLFARGNDRAIRAFSTLNLATLGEIPDSRSSLDWLLPWTDSRHVLFTEEIGKEFPTRTALMIADTTTGGVLGKLCDIQGEVLESPHAAVLLGHGSVLAIVDDNAIRMLDLATGLYHAEPLGTHADRVHSLHRCPDRDTLMSTSADGTVRFWDYADRIDDSPSRAAMVLARVRSAHDRSEDIAVSNQRR